MASKKTPTAPNPLDPNKEYFRGLLRKMGDGKYLIAGELLTKEVLDGPRGSEDDPKKDRLDGGEWGNDRLIGGELDFATISLAQCIKVMPYNMPLYSGGLNVEQVMMQMNDLAADAVAKRRAALSKPTKKTGAKK